MATVSEVKAGLDDISQKIANSRQMRDRAKANLLASRNQLAQIPTVYQDVITTIDGYVGSDAFEALAQDEKEKLAAEFTELKNAMETELTDLGVAFS